jgi:hypothetical protein
MATIASLIVRVAADVSELKTNMEKAESTITKTAKAFAAAFLLNEVKDAALATIEYAGALQNMSDKTGIGTRALQELKFAGQAVQVSLESITGAVGQMQNRLAGSGDKSARAALVDLGIEFNNIRQLSPEAQFGLIAEKLQGVVSPAERTRLAMDLMGKGALEVMPLLLSNLDEMRAKAEALGVVMSERTIKALDGFGNKIDAIKLQGEGLLARVMTPLIEAFDNVAVNADGTSGIVNWLTLRFEALEFAIAKAGKGLTYLFSLYEGGNAAYMYFDNLEKSLTKVDDVIEGMPPKHFAAARAAEQQAASTQKVVSALDAIRKAQDDAMGKQQTLIDHLFGYDAVAKAREYASALANAQGVVHMTKEGMAEANKVFLEGTRALEAQGQAASKDAEQFRLLYQVTADVAAINQAVVDSNPFEKIDRARQEALKRSLSSQLSDPASLYLFPDLSDALAGVATDIEQAAPMLEEASRTATDPIVNTFATAFGAVRASADQLVDEVTATLAAISTTQSYMDAGFVVSSGFGTADIINQRRLGNSGMASMPMGQASIVHVNVSGAGAPGAAAWAGREAGDALIARARGQGIGL